MLFTPQQGFTALDYAKEKGQQEVVGYITSYLNGETGKKCLGTQIIYELFLYSTVARLKDQQFSEQSEQN